MWMPASAAPPACPTWIRGSTSSSSSSPCSIASSSSSSKSRADGGSSAGSSERLRFSAASIRAAGKRTARWTSERPEGWQQPPQARPEPSRPSPAQSGGAARRCGSRRPRLSGGNGRGRPLSAAAVSAAAPAPPSPRRAVLGADCSPPVPVSHPGLRHKNPSSLNTFRPLN